MTGDRISPPQTDKSVKLQGNDHGTEGQYSGEEYDSSNKDQPRFVEVSAGRDNRETDHTDSNSESCEDIPSDVGKRAFIDEKTGEVYGSGAGAGGGNNTEDYDVGTNGAS